MRAESEAPAIGDAETIAAHLERLAEMIRRESNAELLAAAAVMLAVSIGQGPAAAHTDAEI